MALIPHTVTALAESNDEGTDGKNIVAGAVVTMTSTFSGESIVMYDDENYSNGSTAKQTNSKGQVTVYVPQGEYAVFVNGVESVINISETFRFTGAREPQGNMLSSVKLTNNDKWSGKSATILGDSISWGSNCPDVYADSYASVLRRMLIKEKGSESIGFISARGVASNSEGTYQDYHTVSTSGTWSFRNLEDAEESINGFVRFSSDAGARLTFNAPFGNSMFRVFYVKRSGGGTFRVSNNNGSTFQQTVNTDGATDGSAISPLIGMVDSGDGTVNIVIEVVSGEIEICGIQYLNAFDDFMVNNFSDPGRKILHTDTSVFDAACTTGMVIFALGYNDRGSSTEEKTAVTSKIDYLISKAIATKTKIYVIDTNWGFSPSTWIRQELKRLAGSVVGSTYVALPDLLSNNGNVLTISELRDDYSFLSDGAHPTPDGHKNVAETIAKNMGLSVTSKAVVDDAGNGQISVEKGAFTPTVSFANNGDFSPTYTIQEGVYRRVDDIVYYGLTVQFNANSYTTASGLFSINGLPYDSSADDVSFYEYACSIGVIQNVTTIGDSQLTGNVAAGYNHINFRQNLSGLTGGGLLDDGIPPGTNGVRIAVNGWYVAE